MSIADIAKRAGLSEQTVRDIRDGIRGGRPESIAAVERALYWAKGSIEAIRHDGEPSLLPVPETADVELLAAVLHEHWVAGDHRAFRVQWDDYRLRYDDDTIAAIGRALREQATDHPDGDDGSSVVK